jgi:hypothetical protein
LEGRKLLTRTLEAHLCLIYLAGDFALSWRELLGRGDVLGGSCSPFGPVDGIVGERNFEAHSERRRVGLRGGVIHVLDKGAELRSLAIHDPSEVPIGIRYAVHCAARRYVDDPSASPPRCDRRRQVAFCLSGNT